MTRRLVVMRHAKSAWDTPLPDHDRPLNARGRRDAPVAGKMLSRFGVIDRVCCSSSARTRETWALAEAGGAEAREVTFHPEIYEAPLGALLELVWSIPPDTQSALLLGHFPGVAGLVEHLGIRDSHPAWRSLDEKFPTSAIAMLEFECDWHALEEEQAMLTSFLIPRG